MNKSCNGCRALFEGSDYSCSLEYKIREDTIIHGWGKEHRPVPIEKCPKPRTWKQLYNLSVKPAPALDGEQG